MTRMDEAMVAVRDFPAITAGNCEALAYDVETNGSVTGVEPEPLAKFLRHAARMLRRYDALLTEAETLRADSTRLDWLDAQWTNPLHIEVDARGDGGVELRRVVTLWQGSRESAEPSVRACIDAARTQATPTPDAVAELGTPTEAIL